MSHRLYDTDWAQMARYFAGELPEEDARALERRLGDGDGAGRRPLDDAREAWEASSTPAGAWDADAAVRRLRASVADAASRPATGPAFAIQRSSRFWPVAIAASVALVGAVGLGVWSARTRMGNPDGQRVAAGAMTEVVTRRAERAEIRLSDGSRVVLGFASRLRYPRDFGASRRAVELEGEAYFDVVHDDTRPFVVRAGASELRDVGTAFAVRAYGPRPVQVVVTEGMVVARRSKAASDSVLLRANDLAQIDENGITTRTGIAVEQYVAWTRGELVFVDAPLADVAAELSRWFDVDVHVDDAKVGARRFTGSFKRQPVGDVVRAIAAATDVLAANAAARWDFKVHPSPHSSKELAP